VYWFAKLSASHFSKHSAYSPVKKLNLKCILARSIGNTFFRSLMNAIAYGFAALFALILQFTSFIAFVMIDTGN
jgi:hypothetical protein